MKKGIRMDPKYFENMRALAKFILSRPHAWPWTLQGLGMLRLYIEPNLRLHIWDRRFAFPGATPIHDHLQWGLMSTVLSGELHNQRYIETSTGAPYKKMKIKAGTGCKNLEEPTIVFLRGYEPERYRVGESYSQYPSEIHETIPRNGTVTLMNKTPTADPEAATVFWPADGDWGSAEPRDATWTEVEKMCTYALSVWSPLP